MGKLKPGNMVIIHIKKGEETNMLVEHDVSSEIDTVSRDCIMTYNMVLRARRLKSACDDLVRDQGKCLKDYVGSNNKTKIVVQITKKGQGAPTRQAQQQSKSEQESMMQHYFKKKEEWKAMDDDDDDSYLTSAWANPKGMKNSLNGCGNVSWKPGM